MMHDYGNIDPLQGKPTYTTNDYIFRDGASEVCVVKATKSFQAFGNNATLEVAVKCFRKQLCDRKKRRLHREAIALKRVKSMYVASLYEVFITRNHICMAMEYLGGGTLYGFVNRHHGGLDENVARKYFIHVLFGLCDLHSENIVSRDLKAQNVVMDSKADVAKIIDLGYARLNSAECGTRLGTPYYQAPELFDLSAYERDNRCYNGKCLDIWSAGILLYFMLFGTYPFMVNGAEASYSSGTPLEDLKQVIKAGNFGFPRNVSTCCQDIIHSMLRQNPEERLTVEEALEHPWILPTAENITQNRQRNETCFQTEAHITNVINTSIIGSPVDCIDLTT